MTLTAEKVKPEWQGRVGAAARAWRRACGVVLEGVLVGVVGWRRWGDWSVRWVALERQLNGRQLPNLRVRTEWRAGVAAMEERPSAGVRHHRLRTRGARNCESLAALSVPHALHPHHASPRPKCKPRLLPAAEVEPRRSVDGELIMPRLVGTARGNGTSATFPRRRRSAARYARRSLP